MDYKALDTVVLTRDIPAHGLRRGDLGAIVEVFDGSGFEVEFVTASGRTSAVVTVSASDVRPIADTDVVAVRSLDRTA
jgi:hypothetical protein